MNIYLENGEKTMMDLASETVIETINTNRKIYSVVSYNNRDYILFESDYNLGIGVASGYDTMEIVRNSIANVLGSY